MVKEVFSSYQCDCGHISHFSENTIWVMKQKSMKRRVRLQDSLTDKHTIIF